MSEIPTRYNSGIQRSKGILELAAALYDGSLSRKSTRSGTNIPQIDARLGTRIELALDTPGGRTEERDVALSFGVGGSFENMMRVARGELSLLWINPNVPLALAYKGCPPFEGKQPLRCIAVFPSWDAVVVAVHESTGITSLEQIAERRIPLRVSTGTPTTAPYHRDPTMMSVDALIGAAGFSLDDVRAWGGQVHSVSRPSHPGRAEMIRKGEVDAVFDEGILSWGQFALDHGFRILTVEGAVRDRLTEGGYDMIALQKGRLPGLKGPVTSVDFSGWPMVVHADMPDDVAYALCEAIEARKLVIPADNFKALNLAQLCNPDEETPRGAPLHPGAERYWRERGYLKG